MKFGLIGYPLGHSYSKEIHALLADYEYEINQLSPELVDGFMREKSFCAINVTIPYKQTVIPYIDETDGSARAIGAVNTVVNQGGRLKGYNTDCIGLRALIERSTKSLKDDRVLILGGSGGTARTAEFVAADMGAREIYKVSRKKENGCIDYSEAKNIDATVIINATPVGMSPNIFASPVDISCFPNVRLVIDAIYNPLRSMLVLSAEEKGIKAEGGLYMLVSQAGEACKLFTGKNVEKEAIERAFEKLKSQKINIVLTGMPGSGKTTVGKILSDRLGREFYDTDKLIEEKTQMSITEIFDKFGEAEFRNIEAEVIKKLAENVKGSVIATGGGAILRSENRDALKMNGILYFLDRNIEKLVPTEDRPLALTADAVRKRFEERYGIYLSTCDKRIIIDENIENTVKAIKGDFEK